MLPLLWRCSYGRDRIGRGRKVKEEEEEMELKVVLRPYTSWHQSLLYHLINNILTIWRQIHWHLDTHVPWQPPFSAGTLTLRHNFIPWEHLALLKPSGSPVFQGRLVVITGSAQGLGKAFAKRLLQDGARVTIAIFSPILCRSLDFSPGSDIRVNLMVISMFMSQVCLSDIQEPVGLATKAEFQVFSTIWTFHFSSLLIDY